MKTGILKNDTLICSAWDLYKSVSLYLSAETHRLGCEISNIRYNHRNWKASEVRTFIPYDRARFRLNIYLRGVCEDLKRGTIPAGFSIDDIIWIPI